MQRLILPPSHRHQRGPGKKSHLRMLETLLARNAALSTKTNHVQYIPGLSLKVMSTPHQTQEERRARKLEAKLLKATGERATALAAKAQKARLALALKLQAANANNAKKAAA